MYKVSTRMTSELVSLFCFPVSPDRLALTISFFLGSSTFRPCFLRFLNFEIEALRFLALQIRNPLYPLLVNVVYS